MIIVRISDEDMLEACNFIKKETLAQVFSCEFFEISKNTFSYRTTQVAGSVLALYLFITHPCMFFIFHQVVRKPFKFINNGLQINEDLVNETNFPIFLLLFVYLFSAIAWESVQTVSV